MRSPLLGLDIATTATAADGDDAVDDIFGTDKQTDVRHGPLRLWSARVFAVYSHAR